MHCVTVKEENRTRTIILWKPRRWELLCLKTMTDISRVTIECLIQYYCITPSDIVIQLSSTVGDKRNHYIFTRIRWSRERSRSRSRPIRTRRAARALTVTASGRPCRRRRVWRRQTVKMPATRKHPCVRVHGRLGVVRGFGQREERRIGLTQWWATVIYYDGLTGVARTIYRSLKYRYQQVEEPSLDLFMDYFSNSQLSIHVVHVISISIHTCIDVFDKHKYFEK